MLSDMGTFRSIVTEIKVEELHWTISIHSLERKLNADMLAIQLDASKVVDFCNFICAELELMLFTGDFNWEHCDKRTYPSCISLSKWAHQLMWFFWKAILKCKQWLYAGFGMDLVSYRHVLGIQFTSSKAAPNTHRTITEQLTSNLYATNISLKLLNSNGVKWYTLTQTQMRLADFRRSMSSVTTPTVTHTLAYRPALEIKWNHDNCVRAMLLLLCAFACGMRVSVCGVYKCVCYW